MGLDAKSGIYTFDDAPNLRAVREIYGKLREDAAKEDSQKAKPPGDEKRAKPATARKAS